jgi:thiol:disulfide interchange protein DsbA
MSLRKAAALAASIWLVVAGAALAQAPQYRLLSPPQPTEGGGKVEVIEFFWYGCGHCYRLEPFVNAFVKNAPKDVVFRRIPAAPSASWAELAQVYYTLEAMGLVEQLHAKVFDAIHKENLNLSNRKIREDWLAKQGIDLKKYQEVEKSFAVATKMQRARQMTAAYKIDSVPQVIVNGKYVVSAETTGGTERIFPAVEQVIAIARKDKTARTPFDIQLVRR